jgi:hypothetical protein
MPKMSLEEKLVPKLPADDLKAASIEDELLEEHRFRQLDALVKRLKVPAIKIWGARVLVKRDKAFARKKCGQRGTIGSLAKDWDHGWLQVGDVVRYSKSECAYDNDWDLVSLGSIVCVEPQQNGHKK